MIETADLRQHLRLCYAWMVAVETDAVPSKGTKPEIYRRQATEIGFLRVHDMGRFRVQRSRTFCNGVFTLDLDAKRDKNRELQLAAFHWRDDVYRRRQGLLGLFMTNKCQTNVCLHNLL